MSIAADARDVWVVRAAGQRAALEATLVAPRGASWSRAVPETLLDDSGLPVLVPSLWTSVSAWPAGTGSSWVDAIASAAGVTDVFTARLRARSYRGVASWDVDSDAPPWGALAEGARVDAPAAVITSVGPVGDLDATLRFAAAVDVVRRDAETAPGNLGAAVLLSAAMPGTDGLTLTVWESAEAVDAWAYRGSAHRRAMARSGTDWVLSRTSFTRFDVLELRGTWTNVGLNP